MKHLRHLFYSLTLLSAAYGAAAQDSGSPRTVAGTVSDPHGTPLIGVSISVRGAARGTTTGADGRFSLSVPAGAQTLEASLLGFRQADAELSPSATRIDFTLEEDAMILDEMVVVGYTTQSKRTITSAISSIRAEDINGYVGSSVEQSLTGLVPGLRIANADATPDGDLDVHIRGIGSVTSGTTPLYIIDGIPTEDGLSMLNPDDIRDIQVLKDAASTAIYGSRGANGVLLISTKRGDVGKPRVSFNAGITMSQAQRHFQLTNTQQLLEFLDASNSNKRYHYTTNAAQDYFPFDASLDTDWQDAIFRDAWSQRYNLAVSGGSKEISYRISGEFFDQPGVLIHTGMQRYAFRANFDVKMSRRINMSVNFAPSFTDSRQTRKSGENGQNGVIRSAVAMYPFFPVYLPDGTYFSMVEYNRAPTDGAISAGMTNGKFSALQNNPLADNIENPVLIAEQYKNYTRKAKISGSLAFDVQIADGLVFKPSISVLSTAANNDEWYPETIGKNRSDQSAATNSSNKLLMWQNENILSYTKNVCLHAFSAVAGMTISKTVTESLSASAYKFATTSLPSINGGVVNNGYYDYVDDRMLSYLARAGYTYADKYLFTAIFRVDGSSRFGANYPYGYFPSVSGGWIVTEEPFMKSLKPVLTELKLRASWGVTGNNAIGQYNFTNRMSQYNYIFDSELAQGWSAENIGNPNLRWERSNQINLGVDVGFFNNRLFVQADLYRTKTTDMLLNTIVPSTLGVSRMLQNAGSMLNEGFELNVTSRNISKRNFRWTTTFNIAFNRNEVLELGVDAEAIYDGISESNITKKGYPIGMFYGRLVQGIYRSMAEIEALRDDPYSGLAFDANVRPGDLKWVDLNGNGEMDDDDRTIIGNPHPIFYSGMTNTFTYKNFSLGVQLYGQYGNDIYNYALHQLLRGTDNGNKSILIVDRWRSESQPGNGIADRVTTGKDVTPSADKNKFSNRLLEDGSYLSIRNIQFSYTLGKKKLKRYPIDGLTLSVNVDNLHTFTNYTGLNPEASSVRRVTAPGIDQIGYPISRNYTLGLKLIF